MADRNQEVSSDDSLDDYFEPGLTDMLEDEPEEVTTASSQKQILAAKRRRAEQRMEEARLRDELGDYDFRLDDF